MKALKILVVITALVVIVGVTTDAWAQCAQGRIFRSSGKFGNNFKVDASAADDTTNQIGRFWDSDNAAFSNNNLVDGSQCPANLWWLVGNNPGERLIDGALSVVPCLQSGCPTSKLTVVVEDYGTGGPPGVNGTAFYSAWLTEETPASGRWYDYGNSDGATSLTIVPLLPFPEVEITGSSRNAASIQVNYDNVDQGSSVHTWNHALSQVYPTTDVIAEWQLVKATGTADPGRARALGWVTIQTTPYVPGGAPASFDVPCTNQVSDEFLAIGIGFNGGVSGVVDSVLVGPATRLECDPNLANPNDNQLDRKRPSATEIQRSGGRR